MSIAKTCTSCSTVLPDDAPEGALCPACSNAAEAATIMMKAPTARGEVIGDYEVLGKLGQGGMGAVYRARQISLDRVVALKVLPQQFADDPDFVSRFQREARVATSFHHANLVAVYSSGQADGVHFIAMELVEGENLHQRLKRGALSIAEALRICADVARGLQYGWETAQLVHRDIKPSNIYVSEGGVVKLGDLGLAKSLSSNTTGITHTGAMMGTPHYMSPEQARGDKTIDFHADIYSLGCTLYEMLAGQPPFVAADPLAVVRKHMDTAPPSLLTRLPGCPMPLARLVGKMLKKYKLERHLTYAHLIAEIEQVSGLIESGEAQPSLAPTAPRQTPAPVKEPFEWTSTIVGVLILAAILVIFLPKPARKLGEMVPTPAAKPDRKAGTAVPSGPPASSLPHGPLGTAVSTSLKPTAAVSPDFGPWQPLFTDAEWKETVPGKRDFVDGRVHLQGGTSALKPLPAADGAIRARIQFREGSNDFVLQARTTPDNSKYKLLFTQSDARLQFFPGGGAEAILLRRYSLPKPIQPGDTVLLELRLQGDRLTALVDGKVVIEAQDSHIPDSGTWGLMATDGWFESVEVQTPLPAADANGVQTFGGHRYQFVPGSVSWTEAKARAETMGGHLVTITSQAENDWIVTAFGDQLVGTDALWLGGVRDAEASGWRWITGEPFAYTNWRPEQPNSKRFPAFIMHDLNRTDGKEPGWGDRDHSDQTASRLTKGFLVEWDSPAAPPVIATKDAPFVNSLGMKFVPVPGTDVLFCIHETRWRDFAAYAGDGRGMLKSSPDLPVAHINWDHAGAFCAWLSRKEGRTYRLPTDREWSYAVGIGEQEKWDADTTPATVNQVPDQFPWGTDWPPPKGAGNYRDATFNAKDSRADGKYIEGYDDGFSVASPVMSFTPNRLGIYDLGGNMAEWVGDWYDATKEIRVLRGGAFSSGTRDDLLSSKRFAIRSPAGSPGISGHGFRVVLVPPASTAGEGGAHIPPATKEAPFENMLGMKFVPVPITGGPTSGQRVLFSMWETRVQDYHAVATETKRAWDKADFEQGPTHPAVMVNWDEANAFCAWLTDRERQAGKLGAHEVVRLPTDHEWSCAVGIGPQEDAALSPGEKSGKLTGVYFWGTTPTPPANAGNFWSEELRPLLAAGKFGKIQNEQPGYRDGYATTAPVGSYVPNALGIYDLGGNVWERCADWIDARQQARVVRGSSWHNNQGYLQSSIRFAHRPENRSENTGFRCVIAPAESGPGVPPAK